MSSDADRVSIQFHDGCGKESVVNKVLVEHVNGARSAIVCIAIHLALTATRRADVGASGSPHRRVIVREVQLAVTRSHVQFRCCLPRSIGIVFIVDDGEGTGRIVVIGNSCVCQVRQRNITLNRLGN